MIKSQRYLGNIVRQINIIRQYIVSMNLLEMYDIDRTMHNFVQDILNILFDYTLINMGSEAPNYLGIDLGDRKSKIATQVTAVNTSQKINDTLKKILFLLH